MEINLYDFIEQMQVVEILLRTGPSIPNVNLTNGDKETALHCASQYGHIEVYSGRQTQNFHYCYCYTFWYIIHTFFISIFKKETYK